MGVEVGTKLGSGTSWTIASTMKRWALGLLSTPGAVPVGERRPTVGTTQITIPPSTCKTAPVVNELASEAK